jgi:osmotically-inducible protein OsmY
MKALVWALALAVAVTGGFVPMAAAQDRTIGERVDDAKITAMLKTKLAASSMKSLVNVDVDTKNGIVHLKGMVPTEQDRREAETLARGINGVASVQNDLKVATGGSASPATR